MGADAGMGGWVTRLAELTVAVSWRRPQRQQVASRGGRMGGRHQVDGSGWMAAGGGAGVAHLAELTAVVSWGRPRRQQVASRSGGWAAGVAHLAELTVVVSLGRPQRQPLSSRSGGWRMGGATGRATGCGGCGGERAQGRPPGPLFVVFGAIWAIRESAPTKYLTSIAATPYGYDDLVRALSRLRDGRPF
jgi:hypothetical protein